MKEREGTGSRTIDRRETSKGGRYSKKGTIMVKKNGSRNQRENLKGRKKE